MQLQGTNRIQGHGARMWDIDGWEQQGRSGWTGQCGWGRMGAEGIEWLHVYAICCLFSLYF